MRLLALFALGLLFAVTASLTAAGDAKDEAIQRDRKRYTGTWQVVSLEVGRNKAGEERPTDFATTAGSGQMLAVLKRVKK